MKDPIHYVLTDRQLAIMQRIVTGKTTKEIASEFHISPKTVEYHRANIFLQLNIKGSSIALLTHFAIDHGIVELKRLKMPGQRGIVRDRSAGSTQKICGSNKLSKELYAACVGQNEN